MEETIYYGQAPREGVESNKDGQQEPNAKRPKTLADSGPIPEMPPSATEMSIEEGTVEKLWEELLSLDNRREELMAMIKAYEDQIPNNSALFTSPTYKTYNTRKSGGSNSAGPSTPMTKKEKGKGSGSATPTTRLARRTKSRTLVTEAVRLMTQVTPEATMGLPVGQQKMLGVNKEHIWAIFDSLVNAQLPKHEKVTHSSAFKYLFCGLNYLGYKVEPLYGNENIHKTTRKGGGVKRLSGVMWRDFDSAESRDVVRGSLQALTAYGVNVDLERLKQLVGTYREADASGQAPASPPTVLASGSAVVGSTSVPGSSTPPTGGGGGGGAGGVIVGEQPEGADMQQLLKFLTKEGMLEKLQQLAGKGPE